MIEELEKIDTHSIDELIEIKKQRDVLTERLDRLDDQSGKVSDAVIERVRSDYETQQGELEAQAAPLKEEARREFAKLEGLLQSAEKALETTGLNLEELELRHQVGEFGDAEFTEKRKEITEQQSRQEEDLTQIEEIRESFVSAFDSEEDLRASTPAAPPAPEEPPTETPAEAPEEAHEQEEALPPLPPLDSPQETQEVVPIGASETPAAEDSEEPAETEAAAKEGEGMAEGDSAGGEEGEQDAASAGTVIEPYEGEAEPDTAPSASQPMPPDAVPTGGTVLLSVPEAPEDAPEIGATTVLQQARLVPVEPIAGGSEFPVEPITTIGRTKDNLIRVDEPAVSRSHSQISLTDEGYLLRDLGSENGTYVNGERVETRLLQEGDRIQIGTVRFVFYDAGS